MSAMQMLKKSVLLLSKAFCHLPERPAAALASGAGVAAWLTARSERLRIEDCLDRVYFRLKRRPPAPIPFIVKQGFIHFALVACELLRFPQLSKEKLATLVTFNNIAALDEVVKQGRGGILALPHIGNWELLGAAIAHAGYSLNSFFLSQKEDEIGGLLDHFRSYSAIKLHDRDRGGVKALKALRAGELLGMIADQDGANNGVYLDFLGHWVSMPAGPANWSLKTGAALMPLFSLRQGHTFNYQAHFLAPVADEERGTYQERVIARTLRLTRWMENLILAHPHQYLWFYDRFKPRHEAWVTAEKTRNGQMWHGEPRYGT
ncbi:MAG TPA: lysophospholipid acyltransferase family protein [Candidatus Rifleibacterium sp.]|nr:lysophospholipid acyltransferase family protein [Candidatus Rifleibacterium sp.]HPT46589.1 lysophospholipid acyltransferase family protein [Candidatus Rifleibacterium sp.]